MWCARSSGILVGVRRTNFGRAFCVALASGRLLSRMPPRRRRYSPELLLASAAIALAVPNLSGQAPPPATMPNRPVPQSGIVVILDPAHGGTDPGARGPSGVLEKEVVVSLAQALRTEL